MTTTKPTWRLYSLMAIFEAEAFARTGGVAVHLSGDWIPPGRTKPTPCAHVFAPSLDALRAVAVELGMPSSWIQYPDDPKRRHLDVWGDKLAKAKRLCENTKPIERVRANDVQQLAFNLAPAEQKETHP